MTVSAEMYIVISLMFAVFAAVAAIGTSVVLGVGFERLRAGFEIVKKQTGFFTDAIHKLDERTKELDEQQGVLKDSVASMSTRVDRVEKQTGFFSDAINSIEERILNGGPTTKPTAPMPRFEEPAEEDADMPILPDMMEWTGTEETGRLLQERQEMPVEAEQMPQPSNNGLSSMFLHYLRSEGRHKDVVYH